MFEIEQKGFPEREEEVLEFWKRQEIFQKSLENRKGCELFSFYDGPPFATGLPHYGHILAGTIKDVIPRYQTMKGRFVPRRFGWDCHGLPVENEIEKAKELSGAAAIETFGMAKFNEECRSIVLRYSKEWESTVNRMGRFVDFANTYRTMDKDFMESVWWVFGQLWEKDLVYQGFKVMPFSAKLGTPLSNFEANLNYQDVDDPSVTVKFPLEGEGNTALLIWTTTPWTLTSNLAAIVNEKLDYVKLHDKTANSYYILGKSRVAHYFKNLEEYEIVETFKGSKLVGKRYTPPFSYFLEEASPNAFTVLSDDFVGEEDGTGVVHAAPAFGESDFFVCFREKIDVICPIDQNGKFTKEVPEYEGQFVKDADKEIIKKLKAEGRIFHHGQIRHRYPFCWRSDTPLIYKAVETWFVSVEKIKDLVIQANQEIHWVPDHLKDGRFGKWLENARDWAISRNRYWGTPIPLWQSEDGEVRAISSVSQLEKLTGSKIDDLHRHFIDDLTFTENGKTFKRVSEVFDCWFESGSMPYAQNHYPFEKEKETMQGFPADFIAEGLDQTRGWFYTLNILSVALFNKPAFKNVIVNGILLAEDGNKMSKKLKNYPEPSIIINKFGADAIRLYLLHSPAVYGEDLRFSERGVELVLRQFLIPLWNSYVFLATYAKIYSWSPNSNLKNTPKADIDCWILSKLQKLIQDVEKGMDAYLLANAVDPFVGFIDALTNWYIRRSRSRFWSEEASDDRRQAFETLYTVLLTLTKIAAPFIPFISETIYQNLKQESDPESVHLCDFPAYNLEMRKETLEQEMHFVQIAVSMGHGLRKDNKIKVRQPLGLAHIISSDKQTLSHLKSKEHLILDELNVKKIKFHEDESKFVTVSIKPNYRVLGKKVGPLMNKVKVEIEKLDPSLKEFLVVVDGKEIKLTSEDIQIERRVKEGLIASTEGKITIALDIALNEELLLEGLARELVNKINTMRRNEKFDVTDRIAVTIDATDRIKQCFEQYREYICKEVLAKQVSFEPCKGETWDLNGEAATIHLVVYTT
ncbi:MAG: isoleucine--tRNA ligase [Simkaniaceae bacterium]|nr:isoleucine--tRNA ligase [Simkaniaceae bacterium]